MYGIDQSIMFDIGILNGGHENVVHEVENTDIENFVTTRK